MVSIDVVRGMAMILMALDHVRDYFHLTANTQDPLDLQTTTPALFFTRWITHFCAPVFVFLSGTSIYLQGMRKTPRQLGIFLLKRGFWLIAAEWLIISFGWTFNPFYNLIPFQVIWAIGASMVLMGVLVLLRAPYRIMLILGLLITAGHNLLDIPESAPGFQGGFWWDLLHSGFFRSYEYLPGHYIILVYAFPVWLGVMLLGYAAGKYFSPHYDPARRRRFLAVAGSLMLLAFVVLRFSNSYGDPRPWTVQPQGLYTLLSFVDVNKYPPSLLYSLLTLGVALLLLLLVEKTQLALYRPAIIFGRTAFFFYILHIYLIHFLATISYFLRGHRLDELEQFARQAPFLFVVPGEGFGLAGVYGVWLLVLLLLYPLCRRYDWYKTTHRHYWWLSYL